MTDLRIGVVGAGHFGRFHALKLAQSSRARLSGLYDPDAERAKAVAWETGCPPMGLAELFAASDAVVVAAPAEAHYELASQALVACLHVLVEKPIAATLEQADRLGAEAAARGLVLQVGHLERFSAAYQAVKSRAQKPLYIEAVRIAPFKLRGTDVSVILDLMIHDLDLVLALVDSPIESVDAVGAAVASAHDDIANARVRFENGAVATITASRISLKTERKMRIFAETGYLTVDFAARKLTLIGREGGIKLPQFSEGGAEGFGLENASWEDHDALLAEHQAFIASILDGAPVLVDAQAGRRALQAALAVTQSIASSRKRAEASGLITPVLR